MPIEANVTNQQITASVGETKIDVSVGGGVGPTGPAGPQGPAGTASSHASTHAAVGSDPVTLTVAQVTGLQAALDGKQTAGSYAASGHTHDASAINAGTLAAARLPASVVQTDGTGKAIVESLQIGSQSPAGVLFNEGGLSIDVGGVPVLGADDTAFTVLIPIVAVSGISLTNGSGISGVADLVFTDQTTQTTAWTGAIAASAVTSGTLDIARIPTGTTATHVALGSHTHGNLTSAGAIGSTSGLVVVTGASGAVGTLAQGTAGQVLRINSTATGVEWGTAGADVSIDTTAADILSASSGSITADDPGADRIVFWDDSAGKLTHLTVGTGLTITDTTITSAGSTSASDLTSGTLAYARMADPTVTSPSQITASQNDYASFARGINRFTTNAARDITGMVAGSDGEVRVLCNVGTTAANTLTIKDESSSSTAANRFAVPWGGDCVIPAEGSVVVFYDNTSSRWRVV